VPISRAVARASFGAAPEGLSAGAFAALVERVPVPVVAVSGPVPLRVEYGNSAVRAVAGAPRAGEELVVALPSFRNSPCLEALLRLFATDAGPTECEHPAWDGHSRHIARSALFRLPAELGAPPLVAMVGLEGEGERAARAALAERLRELEHLRRQDERHNRWLDAISTLAGQFQTEPGPAVVEAGLDVVIRQTNAVDGALATYVSGRLAVQRSRRGLLPAGELTVVAHPELARALRDAAPVWLDRIAAAALGVPAGVQASALPIVVAAEPLGALVFLFNEIEPHDADNRRVLAAFSAAMGFGLLRDRLTRELREAVSGSLS